MNKSSVFVLLVLIMSSCGDPQFREMNDIVGEYNLQPGKKPVMERIFSSSNVSGWNYDGPCNVSLKLNSDSTYEESCYGGGFEMADYRGTWSINGDSILLLPLYEVFGAPSNEKITKLEGVSVEILRIKSSDELEVCSIRYADKGRTLKRR